MRRATPLKWEVCASLSRIYLGGNALSLETGAELAEISRVILQVDDSVSYTAGNDLGRSITISCPWGTQKMAEDLLDRFRYYRYQPYTASGAAIDPAAELGDYVDTGAFYGGIFSRRLTFGRRLLADLSAPGDNEVDHEYPYESRQSRETRRVRASLRQVESEFLVQASQISARVSQIDSDVQTLSAELTVQASQIAAKVSSVKDGTDFGWVLTGTGWEIRSGGATVLKADKNGLEVTGKITASSGKIGGFDIQRAYLSNPPGFNAGDSTTASGVYIGTNGIKLGQGIWLDAGGSLYAKTGTFEGNVWAGSIQSGGGYGTFDGYGITESTVGTGPLTGGVVTSLGYGNFANDVFNNVDTAPYVRCNYVSIGGKRYAPYTLGYLNSSGSASKLTILATQD